jgi:hypothetical protein
MNFNDLTIIPFKFFLEIFFVVQLMLNQPYPLNIRSDGKVLSLAASASYSQELVRSIMARGMAAAGGS